MSIYPGKIPSKALLAAMLVAACGLALAAADPKAVGEPAAEQASAATPEAAAPVAPQNSLEGLDVSTQGGKVVVKLTLKEPLTAPRRRAQPLNPEAGEIIERRPE